MTEFNTIGKNTIQMPIDSVPTDGSSNPVSSNGVYDALTGKQDTLTFDATPTDNSTNPVTSDGIYTALSGKQPTLSTAQQAAVDSGITSSKVSTYDGYATAISDKQNALSSATATLASANWENSTQTVNVIGMTGTVIVWVSPTPTSISSYGASGVCCSSQANGTLTFTCTSVPLSDLTVNIVFG